MHNLLLGSAQKVFECWMEKGILKEKNLEEIDHLIEEVPIPSDVGRVAGSVLISLSHLKMKSLKIGYFIFQCIA